MPKATVCRLLAKDVDGTAAGVPATLETSLPGAESQLGKVEEGWAAVVGQGVRLFSDSGPDLVLDLVDSRVDSKGVTIQVYRLNGRPEYPTAR